MRQDKLYREKGKYNPSLILAYQIAQLFNSQLTICLFSKIKNIQCENGIFGRYIFFIKEFDLPNSTWFIAI
jgi:DNA-binding XRE family transcriptional regulator